MVETAKISFWNQLLSLDARLSASLALRSPLLIRLATYLAHTGDAVFWLIGAGGILLLVENALWREIAVRIIMATTVGGVVSTLLKWTFRRQRPPGPAGGLYFSLDQHALPSGHATRAACLAVALGPVFPLGWIGPLLGLWAVLVSFSRVALQVHYLLDIIVGLAVGSLVGLGVVYLL